jgi:nucleotide-binding universal stress UspA family protein
MYSKILVGTDGSETAAEAVRQAAELAKLHGAELIVLHGAKTSTGAAGAAGAGFTVVPIDKDAIRSAGEEILQQATAGLGSEVKARAVMREGDPADAIIDAAEEEGADLIVVGNRGMQGAKRFLLGSVPNRVAHHAPCSVLIVHTS